MAENLEDAKEMIKVEKKTKGFLQIGFELHYSKIYMRSRSGSTRG